MKIIAISFLIGCFGIFLANKYLNIHYSANGSFDIIAGALLEFFFLQILLQYWNYKSDQNLKNSLQNHLSEIEKLLRKK